MKLVLSRFACVRREGTVLVADALAHPVAIDDMRVLGLLAALVVPRPLDEAAGDAGLAPEEAAALAAPMIDAGVLIDASEDTRDGGSWHSHDLRFHARTRMKLGDLRVGMHASLPGPLPPGRGGERVTLPRPDLDALERDDPPLALVQSQRRSIRVPGPEPLNVDALGEFLYRVGRVEDLWRLGPGVDIASRPYPAAGAQYELEINVAVERCDGVARGVYIYRADDHALERLNGPTEDVELLLTAAAAGMGVAERPDTLLILGARFDRIAWKYGPLAYSLVLKNVGVLLQTMYMVATAMGLAPCAIGTGDADAFARATGYSRDEQTSVGEFALSSGS